MEKKEALERFREGDISFEELLVVLGYFGAERCAKSKTMQRHFDAIAQVNENTLSAIMFELDMDQG